MLEIDVSILKPRQSYVYTDEKSSMFGVSVGDIRDNKKIAPTHNLPQYSIPNVYVCVCKHFPHHPPIHHPHNPDSMTFEIEIQIHSWNQTLIINIIALFSFNTSYTLIYKVFPWMNEKLFSSVYVSYV